MTFSSDSVRRSLNHDFVCTLINTTGDPSAGSSCKHAPTDSPGPCSRGIGHQNVQCLFLTPAGEIFHAASGFLGTDDMEKELAFARELYRRLKKDSAQARQIVTQSHALRLKELGFAEAEIRQPRQAFFGGSGLVLFGQQSEPPANNKAGQGKGAGFNRSLPQMPGNAFGGQQGLFPSFPGFGGFGGFGGLGGGGGAGGNFFDQMLAAQTQRTVLNDHKFSIEHPLLPMSEFVRRPQLLVGNEKTSFVSVGSGGAGGRNTGK